MFSDTRTSSGSWVKGTVYWTAVTTTITIEFVKNSSTSGTMLFDSISINKVNGNAGVLVNFDGTDFKTDVPR